jgi:prepilin-type N-terminal cleavage/methylation domain-containing protein
MRRPNSRSSRIQHAGFTIIEMLVVISIIAILLSVASVGIINAGRSARQTKYLSNLKQIATAWNQYAGQNDDRCMPGFMDDRTQEAFRIKVRDRDGNRVQAQFCRTYPYRILPFLDHDRSLMYDYLTEYEQTSLISPQEIADNPAFGYNAYYLGGWWTTDAGSTEEGAATPRMKFSNTGYFKSPGQLVARQEMVARTLSQIQRPSDMIVFASSYRSEPGFIKSPNEIVRGAAWVVPHTLGTTNIWASSDGQNFNLINASGASPSGDFLAQLFGISPVATLAPVPQGGAGMDVYRTECVPLRRIKNSVPTVRADLSTESQGLRDLMNQGRWMNNAGYSEDPIAFTHPEN